MSQKSLNFFESILVMTEVSKRQREAHIVEEAKSEIRKAASAGSRSAQLAGDHTSLLKKELPGFKVFYDWGYTIISW